MGPCAADKPKEVPAAAPETADVLATEAEEVTEAEWAPAAEAKAEKASCLTWESGFERPVLNCPRMLCRGWHARVSWHFFTPSALTYYNLTFGSNYQTQWRVYLLFTTRNISERLKVIHNNVKEKAIFEKYSQ